jgi:hypothetical protein
MTDLRKAAEMALEALKKSHPISNSNEDLYAHSEAGSELYNELKKAKALAQPEQEPVGFVTDSGMSAYFLKGVDLDDDTPLYTAPPKQPEQEPVGTYEGVMETMLSLRNGTIEQQQVYGHMKDKLLYTAPPKREWVGLTDDEIHKIVYEQMEGQHPAAGFRVANCIEAKLKEKNFE